MGATIGRLLSQLLLPSSPQPSPSGFGGPGQNQGAKGLSLGPFEVRGTGWIQAEPRAAIFCSCNKNATEANRLKELEQENNRLKRLLAAAPRLVRLLMSLGSSRKVVSSRGMASS